MFFRFGLLLRLAGATARAGAAFFLVGMVGCVVSEGSQRLLRIGGGAEGDVANRLCCVGEFGCFGGVQWDCSTGI